MQELLSALQAAADVFAPGEGGAKITAEWAWLPRPLPWPVIGPVVAAIAKEPEILMLTRLHQVSLGASKGQRLYDKLLASALVKRTRALGTAAAAVQELLGLVAANEGHARITMVLAGVNTPGAVEIMPGVELVPLTDVIVPDCFKDLTNPSLWPMSRDTQPLAPSAALVSRHLSYSPAFTPEEDHKAGFPMEEVDRLHAAANCIGLAAGRHPAIFKVLVEDDDPRFPLASSGILFTSPYWGGGAVAGPFEVDVARVREIAAHYLNFGSDRAPLDTAMQRLAEARSGWRLEDRALDLGIALEAVLMHAPGGGQDANAEIGFKLGLRAAWLVGVDGAERVQVHRQVKRLYGLRSKAAHSGRIKSKAKSWLDVETEINAGADLAGRIICAVLARDAWPDWEELVLAGKDTTID